MCDAASAMNIQTKEVFSYSDESDFFIVRVSCICNSLFCVCVFSLKDEEAQKELDSLVASL